MLGAPRYGHTQALTHRDREIETGRDGEIRKGRDNRTPSWCTPNYVRIDTGANWHSHAEIERYRQTDIKKYEWDRTSDAYDDAPDRWCVRIQTQRGRERERESERDTEIQTDIGKSDAIRSTREMVRLDTDTHWNSHAEIERYRQTDIER